MIYVPPREIGSAEGEWAFLLWGQKKLVTTAQARSLGLTPDELRWKVKGGQWQRVYRGVYAAFSGQLTREQQLWAVVLHIGEEAVLSHETAAELQGFARQPSGEIHVTVPLKVTPTRWRDLARVVVHRTANLRKYEVPWFELPRTPAWDTVIDLVESARDLDDAYGWLSRAITKGNVPPGLISAALGNRRKVRRRSWLEDALTDVSDGVHFPLERRWVRDVERAHGFPKPTRQVRRDGAAGTRFLDNLYQPWDISVELDGMAFHPQEDFDTDRYRDNETWIQAGANVLRYGFKLVANHPCKPAAQFARALIKHGWDAATLRPCNPACPVADVIESLRKARAAKATDGTADVFAAGPAFGAPGTPIGPSPAAQSRRPAGTTASPAVSSAPPPRPGPSVAHDRES